MPGDLCGPLLRIPGIVQCLTFASRDNQLTLTGQQQSPTHSTPPLTFHPNSRLSAYYNTSRFFNLQIPLLSSTVDLLVGTITGSA